MKIFDEVIDACEDSVAMANNSDRLKLIRCGCGGKAHLDFARSWDPEKEEWIPNSWHRVICRKCGTQTIAFYTEAEAITAWNRAMRRAKVYILLNTSEDKGEISFCPYCGDELE